MQRDELERLSKDELIELVLRLQRPAKTSRTSSKPPSTDRKERREQARPGGAKPGHEGHSRTLSTDPDCGIGHAPQQCPCCRLALSSDLPSEAVGAHERIELPEVKPVVEHHRRLAVRCPGCGARVVAAPPPAATGTPFGPRLHALATYLKTFQSLSYERLQATLADLFGLPISQGGLMTMLRHPSSDHSIRLRRIEPWASRAQGCFQAGRAQAVAALRRAEVVASDETGVRIEGNTGYHWVFRCAAAVVHHAASTRAAAVVHAMMAGHKPAVWLSDRHAAQQGHGLVQQTCLAHLARDVACALEASDDQLPFRLKLWLASAFALPDSVAHLAASTVAATRRALERRLGAILAAPTTCDLAAALQAKLRRARDQLLTFADWPGQVEATNNACERHLRPAVIQRKVTNGYRATWAAKGGAAEGSARGSAWKGSGGEADIRTVVDTARLKPGTSVFSTILQTITA
jgi:transposase